MTTVTNGLLAIRDMLHEPTAAAWSNSELKRYWNKANKDFARRTFCIDDTANVSAIALTNEYTVAANILRIDRVEWTPTGDTRKTPLSPRAYDAMDKLWGDYQDTHVADPHTFSARGTPPALKLKVYPTPYTTGTFKLFVARLPVEITVDESSSDSAVIDLPTGWDEVPYDYVVYMAFKKDKQYETAKFHLEMYEQKVADAITLIDNYTSANDEMLPDMSITSWLFDPYQ